MNCDICGKGFTRKDNLNQHRKKHFDKTLHCDECGQSFSRLFTLNRHKERVHQTGSGQKRPSDNEDTPTTKRLRTNDDPRQFYVINKIREQRIPKFRTIGSTYKVLFKEIEITEDVFSTLRRLFETILRI